MHNKFNKLVEAFLDENNTAVFLGRFQPPTDAHLSIINTALNDPSLKISDVYIIVVRGKKTSEDKEKNPFPFELQEKILKKLYPDVQVVTASAGYIPDILDDYNITTDFVFAGTDRARAYQAQLDGAGVDVEVIEIPRATEDISATKLRTALREDDYETAVSLANYLIDKELYEELKQYV